VDTLGAVVLSGGRARRFGSDKTRATVAGITLLERVLAVVGELEREGLVDEVVIVGDWAPEGVRLEPEPARDQGPLAGLAHGLRSVDADSALVLAADHPWLEPALLRLLVERSSGDDTGAAPAAVVPIGATGPEPLVAWYRSDLADTAEQLVAHGRASLRGFLDVIDTLLLPPEVWQAADPEGRSFLDVDTRDDLDRMDRPDRGRT